MSNFNKIIKEKVEHFEAPFNEAHWADMEKRLNTAKSNNSRLLFGSAAAIITIIAFSYFLFSTNTTTTLEPTKQIEQTTQVTPDPEINNTVSLEKEELDNVVAKDETPVVIEKNTPAIAHVAQHKPKNVMEKQTVEAKEIQQIVETASPNAEIVVEKKAVEEVIPAEKTTLVKAVETKIEEKTTPIKEIPVVTTSKRKNVRLKAYEDENVTKKSVRRSRRRPFISFKKRLYKVPLSKRKSKKK